MKDSARLAALSVHTLWLQQLRDKVEVMEASGVDVINLGLGNPDLPTPPHVVEAAQAALTDPATHRYPSFRGRPEFTSAMARHYLDRWGVALDPATAIVPSTGSQEAINTVVAAFSDRGDVVLAGDPGYGVHFSAAALAGTDAVSLPLDPVTWQPDFAALDPAHVAAASVMFLCYPNNPTGVLAGAQTFAAAVDFARRHDVVLVHDFAYAEIAFDGHTTTSVFETAGARDVAVELYSMTKGYSMAGWRLGAVVGNPDLIDRYLTFKAEIDNGTFDAVQLAGAAALDPHRQDVLEEHVAVYRRRRDLVCAALEAGGVPVTPPPATPYIWSPVPPGFESCAAFAQYVLDEVAVAISPGWAFGEHGTDHYRISLMAPDEDLAVAAERLASLNLA